MKNTKSISIEFYQNIGKLFYAIAAADNIVREKEYNTLKKIVNNEWLSVDNFEDEFGTNAIYQIEVVFDWLYHQELKASICFNEFIAYKKEHKYLFTDKMKQLILKTAGKIASSFSGLNKSELVMLTKLNIELKKI